MKKIALFANYDKPDAIKWSQYAAEKLSKLGAECCADISLIEQYDDLPKRYLSHISQRNSKDSQI
jgi:hypothetical protein